MGIFTRQVEYLSDRGDTFELGNMQSSHLLNVIHHHSNQVTTLELMMDDKRFATEQALARLNGLKETILALQAELATRDPEEDHTTPRSKQEDRW